MRVLLPHACGSQDTSLSCFTFHLAFMYTPQRIPLAATMCLKYGWGASGSRGSRGSSRGRLGRPTYG